MVVAVQQPPANQPSASELKEKLAKMDIDVESSAEQPRRDPDLLTIEDIWEQLYLIEKGVIYKDSSLVGRVVRMIPSTRKRLNNNILCYFVKKFSTLHEESQKFPLVSFFDQEDLQRWKNLPPAGTRSTIGDRSRSPSPQASLKRSTQQSDKPTSQSQKAPVRTISAKAQPEVDVYIHMLLLINQLDTKNLGRARVCADLLMKRLCQDYRRSLDSLAARCYFYYSRCYELIDQLYSIRSALLHRLQTCILRQDIDGRAMLINLLLRIYLHYDLYDQADKLISRCPFPELGSNNQTARFCYYLGRIKAVQLCYSEAHQNLQQALRKAGAGSGASGASEPKQCSSVLGFRQTVQKLAVVVELLMGDIPDRSIFCQAGLQRTLRPYFWLTQAVRSGDLASFNKVLDEFKDKFLAEHTLLLIVRLRHNVIKTGVRKISISYSNIFLIDVAKKLRLDSEEDAEYICAKAIRDGVINECWINHERGFMQSREKTDLYTGDQPMMTYDQRIRFCLDLHNQSVRAMRYPDKTKYNDDESETPEERREREQMELESAKEIADEDFDGGFL